MAGHGAGAPQLDDIYQDRLENCLGRVAELEEMNNRTEERLNAYRNVEDIRRREEECEAELQRTRKAVAELEEDLAAPPVDREELRTRLRAVQAENLELNQELARLRREQNKGVCERDTCVGYEERVARLSQTFRAIVGEFADRFHDPEAMPQRVVDTLVGAANARMLEWLESLLAKMQDRPIRALRGDKVFVQDVVLLEQNILTEHRKLLLEQKELRERDAEVRRQVEALKMIVGDRPKPEEEERLAVPRAPVAWMPLQHVAPKGSQPPAQRKRPGKKHQPVGLLRPPFSEMPPQRLDHPALAAPTPRDDDYVPSSVDAHRGARIPQRRRVRR